MNHNPTPHHSPATPAAESLKPDQPALPSSTHLVKIGDEGTLTIAIPEMAGRYIMVEQQSGRVIITPFDLEWEARTGVIARHGRQWKFLGNQDQEITHT